VIVNRKIVKKNPVLRANQKADKKANRDWRLDWGGVLKRNIGKIAALSSETPVGALREIDAAAETVDAQALTEKLTAAGLTGMSGSGFPTAKKIRAFLASKAERRILLINGAECEPGMLTDAWLLKNRQREILSGAAALCAALKPERAVLATRGKTFWFDGVDTGTVEAVRVPLKYPMGEEHFLIRQALGVDLAQDARPAEQGILVLNLQTVYQIFRILNGSYDGKRFVTLADLRTGAARIACVDDQTDVRDALTQAFGTTDGEIYVGGGVISAVKAASGAVFTADASFAALSAAGEIDNETRCKKCGGCTSRCPMGIRVKDIVLARQDDPAADVSGFDAAKCIGCGTCTYFCGAGKDPMAYVAAAKRELRA
jgi:electron transport complex protein RnfC